MTKHYRAYDERTDRWRYFKLHADDKGWSISTIHYQTGDQSIDSVQKNFEMAYENLQQVIEKMQLTKLTEASDTEL